jgi:dCMP deaminase
VTSIRPTFESIFLELSRSLSRRSTCVRLSVGAVITSEDFRKVYAVGYNGNASGLPNTCDRQGAEAVGNCGCLHAEENAVINCDVDRTLPKVLFCSHLPCVMCAKRIVNLGGVRKVFYGEDYRIRTSIEIFDRVGIVHELVAAVP